MQVSTTTTNMQSFWLCISLLISCVCGIPSAGLRDETSVKSRSQPVTLNTVHNHNYVANGTAALLKAQAKYAHLKETSTNDKVGNPAGVLTGFAEADDREWLCPVKIGTPGQTVHLDLDTGSADLWVFTPDSGSRKGELGDRKVYSPTNSSTAHTVNGSSWSISYGDGSYAGGKVYTDTVEISGLKVHNATVEVASRYSSNLVRDDAPLSGLMGLAINLTTTTRPAMPGILSQLSDQGIDHIFVDLQYHNDGTFNFGEVNNSAYTSPMSYQPVVPDKGYWWIEMTTIRMGDSNETMIHSWDVIVDTGTSLFLGPSDIVKDYYAKVPSAEFSRGDGAYVFHCNETLPDFHFGFANDWSEFTVPGAFMNYSTAPVAGDHWCYGGIQDSDMEFSIVGDVFLKAVYVDFNIAEQSIGFASKKLNLDV